MSLAFSDGMEKVVHGLGCGSRPWGKAQFPQGFNLSETRFRKGETVRGWFTRCVKDVLGGDPERCQVEDNLALFLSLGWESKDELTFLRCQVLVTLDTDLLTYSLEQDQDHEAHYLRLDFDRGELGPMFTHPLPHIHVNALAVPRFPLESPTSNVFMDFMDFVYRNYLHARWLEWAKEVSEEDALRRSLENSFEAVEKAFKANQVDALRETYRDELVRMKQAWRREKDELFPLRLGQDHRELLSYVV